MSFPLIIIRGGDCARDCRLPVLDFPTYSPGPGQCAQCLRTISACKCSCIDMFPPQEPTDTEVYSNFVEASLDLSPTQCYCVNGVDQGSVTAGVVLSYSFAWDETYGLNLSQYLLTKAAITCPDNPHTTFKIYKSSDGTNLSCVSSSADWVHPPIAESDLDPEPTGSAPSVTLTPPLVDGTSKFDCAAFRDAQPEAFLLEVVDGCGNVLLLCPTLNPGSVGWTCPSCDPICPQIVFDGAGTSATACDGDGNGECTVTFSIDCALCPCAAGFADVTFTLSGGLGGDSVTVSGVAVSCGGSVMVSTPAPLGPCGDGQQWRVDVAWHCTDGDCTVPPGCTGIYACLDPTTGTVNVAINGGIVP